MIRNADAMILTGFCDRYGIGFLAMVAGIALQYSRYDRVVGQQNILHRLHAVDDQFELTCSLRISKRAIEDGIISEDGVLAVVHREYSKRFDFNAVTVRGIAQSISHRLVREHRILELHGDERGLFLIPHLLKWLIGKV